MINVLPEENNINKNKKKEQNIHQAWSYHCANPRLDGTCAGSITSKEKDQQRPSSCGLELRECFG
jgi:hypothetical protein